MNRIDISNVEQIQSLVDRFYERVVQDPLLAPIFVEVAQLDFEEHLPKMYRFWNSILLGHQSYRSNAMQVHRALHSLEPLTPEHFQRWLSLWAKTVDESFAGPTAEKAKGSAETIATSMQWVLHGLPPLNPPKRESA